MRIVDVVSRARIVGELEARTKGEVLRELASHVAGGGTGIDLEALVTALEERERQGPSTGLEHGVAIPHAKLPGLSAILGCFGRSREGIPFGAHDGEPSRLFFLLAVPEAAAFRPLHLKALARVARLLRSPEVRASLIDAADADRIWEILAAEDERP